MSKREVTIVDEIPFKCFDCGGRCSVAFAERKGGEERIPSLVHPIPTCASFDAVGATTDDAADYLRRCREGS